MEIEAPEWFKLPSSTYVRLLPYFGAQTTEFDEVWIKIVTLQSIVRVVGSSEFEIWVVQRFVRTGMREVVFQVDVIE